MLLCHFDVVGGEALLDWFGEGRIVGKGREVFSEGAAPGGNEIITIFDCS